MPKVNLTVLDRNNTYLNYVATVLDTTRSQVINDLLEHINKEDLENDIWDNWDEAEAELKDIVESAEEAEAEEED